MVRRWIVLLMLVAAGIANADTLVAQARVSDVGEREIGLTLGTESLRVTHDKETKAWRNMLPSTATQFLPGELVSVRVTKGVRVHTLREISDEASSRALSALRTGTVGSTVVRADGKVLTVQIESGKEFSYRYTEKSKLEVGGKPSSFADIRKGQVLFIKGRLLSNLDTWIVSATDVRPADTARITPKQPAPQKVSPSGKFKGLIDLHQPQFSMVDLFIGDELVHVVYTPKTTVKLEGGKADFSDIQRGLWAQVYYRRDQFGRMIASKIELFHGNGS